MILASGYSWAAPWHHPTPRVLHALGRRLFIRNWFLWINPIILLLILDSWLLVLGLLVNRPVYSYLLLQRSVPVIICLTLCPRDGHHDHDWHINNEMADERPPKHFPASVSVFGDSLVYRLLVFPESVMWIWWVLMIILLFYIRWSKFEPSEELTMFNAHIRAHTSCAQLTSCFFCCVDDGDHYHSCMLRFVIFALFRGLTARMTNVSHDTISLRSTLIVARNILQACSNLFLLITLAALTTFIIVLLFHHVLMLLQELFCPRVFVAIVVFVCCSTVWLLIVLTLDCILVSMICLPDV